MPTIYPESLRRMGEEPTLEPTTAPTGILATVKRMLLEHSTTASLDADAVLILLASAYSDTDDLFNKRRELLGFKKRQ